MKKNNRGLIVLALLWGILLSIFLCFPRESLAQCLPNALSSNCTDDYNCDNNWSIEGNNPAWCQQTHPGSCIEVIDDGISGLMTYCFASKGQPTPTRAPCGTKDYNCCPAPDYCLPGLTPDSAGQPGQCFCREASSSPYPTSSLQAPTHPPPPAAGGEEGIDFGGLSGAIPSLKPIFQAGPASNVGEIISTILPYLFVFAGLLLLFYLIYGGFHMMIAAGDEKGLALAKGKITNALIGFLLLFISYWLVQVVEFILGIQIF